MSYAGEATYAERRPNNRPISMPVIPTIAAVVSGCCRAKSHISPVILLRVSRAIEASRSHVGSHHGNLPDIPQSAGTKSCTNGGHNGICLRLLNDRKKR
jgi:hypothetical protein